METLYKTKNALYNQMRETVEEALELTYKILYDKLMEYIDKYVYDESNITKISRIDGHQVTGGWYRRDIGITEDIKNAFDYDIYKYNEIRGKITFDSKKINHSGWSHGNPQKALNGRRFLRILNNEADQGSIFNFPYVKRTPFWDEFEKYAKKNTKIIYAKKLVEVRNNRRNFGLKV